MLCLFKSRVESQVIRDTRYRTASKRAVKIQTIIRTRNQNFGITDKDYCRIRIDKQRSVLYNITINCLTLNQHRIKINVLMG